MNHQRAPNAAHDVSTELHNGKIRGLGHKRRGRAALVVGRIFLSPGAPQDRPSMWASGHNGEIRRAAHGYEATREAAMAAFAKSWRSGT
jgi:hypothetical protein